jgi:hypothetical protein
MLLADSGGGFSESSLQHDPTGIEGTNMSKCTQLWFRTSKGSTVCGSVSRVDQMCHLRINVSWFVPDIESFLIKVASRANNEIALTLHHGVSPPGGLLADHNEGHYLSWKRRLPRRHQYCPQCFLVYYKHGSGQVRWRSQHPRELLHHGEQWSSFSQDLLP